ncbi:MAG: FadR family transcriptional regulator [Solirubrobacteraceae bacterium]|nr:FadR family transcriptional regulator [Solirubrobacteraceae bacterium]
MSVPNSGLVSDRVFDDLLRRVLQGEYLGGQRLPTQRQLAAEQGVTLSSLREALKRLEQMGLLDVRHGDATYVRDWREHGTLDVLGHLLMGGGRFDADVLRDILEARSLCLREIAGLAAAKAQAEDDRVLAGLAADVAAATDMAAATAADYAFFAALAKASKNIVFVLLLNAIGDVYLPQAPAIPVAASHAEIAPLYAQLAEAVATRDAAVSRELAWRLAERQRADVLGMLG